MGTQISNKEVMAARDRAIQTKEQSAQRIYLTDQKYFTDHQDDVWYVRQPLPFEAKLADYPTDTTHVLVIKREESTWTTFPLNTPEYRDFVAKGLDGIMEVVNKVRSVPVSTTDNPSS